MNTFRKPLVLVLAIAAGAVVVPSTFADGETKNDEAMTLAKKLTREGAATFNRMDAEAMAAYYTDDAIVFVEGKKDGEHSVKEYDGRTAIEGLYADLFKDQATIQAENHVEYARFLAPDVLVIAGTFEPNQLAADPLKIPFYQVRVKRGDKWLIHSLRIFVLPKVQ